MKTRLLLIITMLFISLSTYAQKKSKGDFKDIFDLDAIKSDQDYFSQAIIQFQLLEKIIQKYGTIYHLFPKENPSLMLKRGQLKLSETTQFDINNGVPTMVLFGNTILDGDSNANKINEELYQLGVDRCQYQIPLRLSELDGGFQFNHYMFSSKNSAALNAFGIVKNNYDSETLYIIIDYIQYKDSQCPGIPKIRYGVGIRSEIKISNWSNKLNIKESSLAGLAASAEIGGLKVNITVKTIGITGLDSKLNIPSNTSFDVNTFADYQKIIDFIRQFDDKSNDTIITTDTNNTNLTPVEVEIKDLKKAVQQSLKQNNNYDNIVFKPQMIPVMDEYRTSISQSFKSFYETLNDFEKRINQLMKDKKNYEKLKNISQKTALDSAKIDIYDEKISAILEEIKDVKSRKNDLKEANNLVYDLERFKKLLRVITNYKAPINAAKDGEVVDTNAINEKINDIYNSEYYIIVGADKDIVSAKDELKKALEINAYSTIIKKGDWYRTIMPNYKSSSDAQIDFKKAQIKFSNSAPQLVDKNKWCSKGVEQGEECLICKE